jgi:hypothetical protein
MTENHRQQKNACAALFLHLGGSPSPALTHHPVTSAGRAGGALRRAGRWCAIPKFERHAAAKASPIRVVVLSKGTATATAVPDGVPAVPDGVPFYYSSDAHAHHRPRDAGAGARHSAGTAMGSRSITCRSACAASRGVTRTTVSTTVITRKLLPSFESTLSREIEKKYLKRLDQRFNMRCSLTGMLDTRHRHQSSGQLVTRVVKVVVEKKHPSSFVSYSKKLKLCYN